MKIIVILKFKYILLDLKNYCSIKIIEMLKFKYICFKFIYQKNYYFVFEKKKKKKYIYIYIYIYIMFYLKKDNIYLLKNYN